MINSNNFLSNILIEGFEIVFRKFKSEIDVKQEQNLILDYFLNESKKILSYLAQIVQENIKTKLDILLNDIIIPRISFFSEKMINFKDKLDQYSPILSDKVEEFITSTIKYVCKTILSYIIPDLSEVIDHAVKFIIPDNVFDLRNRLGKIQDLSKNLREVLEPLAETNPERKHNIEGFINHLTRKVNNSILKCQNPKQTLEEKNEISKETCEFMDKEIGDLKKILSNEMLKVESQKINDQIQNIQNNLKMIKKEIQQDHQHLSRNIEELSKFHDKGKIFLKKIN